MAVEEVLQSLEQQSPEESPLYTGFKQRLLDKILKHLSKRPYTCQELADLTGFQRYTVSRYLQYLTEELQSVEPVKDTAKPVYYQLKGQRYRIDFENCSIDKIPEIQFYQIPIIEHWYTWASGNPARMDDLQTFRNICYGKIVPSFKVNPMHWQHEKTTLQFYSEYKKHFRSEYKPHIIDALKRFLTLCQRVVLTQTDMSYLGLKQSSKGGKYRFLKLTDEEIQQAEAWLQSKGTAIASSYNIAPLEILAHYAFCTEGFPRPSRTLTIKVQDVEKHPLHDGLCLSWLQYETKQERPFPKLMLDPKLVGWAIEWLERRRNFHYQYLFLNDNKYQPHAYDSDELRTERERFAAVYKEMFKALGKTEPVFYNDTLYCLRHIGVQKWISRCGFSAYGIIASMGWESVDTLVDFYGAMTPQDILKAIPVQK